MKVKEFERKKHLDSSISITFYRAGFVFPPTLNNVLPIIRSKVKSETPSPSQRPKLTIIESPGKFGCGCFLDNGRIMVETVYCLYLLLG